MDYRFGSAVAAAYCFAVGECWEGSVAAVAVDKDSTDDK